MIPAGILSGGGKVRGTGGQFTVDLNGYRYHLFTASGTLMWQKAPSTTQIEVLEIAGGGNGGGGGSGGGAGAGGVRLWTPLLIRGLASSAVTVGGRGQDSSFVHVGGTLIAGAGGTGPTANAHGASGGSGSGASGVNPAWGGNALIGGAASGNGVGNRGGNGGSSTYHYSGAGGGGYAAAGGDRYGDLYSAGGGNGGAGIPLASIGDISTHSIFAGMTHLASGGGGGGYAAGGTGGPGAGNGGAQSNGGNATSFGSGGGGANFYDMANPQGRTGGNGYQGLIIVRYPL